MEKYGYNRTKDKKATKGIYGLAIRQNTNKNVTLTDKEVAVAVYAMKKNIIDASLLVKRVGVSGNKI